MRVPPTVSYRGLDKTDALERLIDEKIAKLEKAYQQISSCRVAIEKVHDHPTSGSPYRVRLDIMVPEDREIVVDKSPDQAKQYPPLEAIIRDAFDVAFRQLRELNDRQHNHMKTHIPGEREIILDDLPSGEVPAPPADATAE